ncbi:MAG: patatin-like phospholipase family protein [Marinifilaceae bacterium]
MKRLVLLLLLFCVGCTVFAQRKKVGLVLGGGGAKGAAHVGVLKVLEEEGIPVDYIAGTSIGAIGGALYSIGYDAAMLDTLMRSLDWENLMRDNVDRTKQTFSSKLKKDMYAVSIPLSKEKFTFPAGIIAGQNIYNLFTDLTVGYHELDTFSKLPIPFSAVAVDLVSGKDVVLDKGSLPTAMRASMSIPGVFVPVELDDMILIDGGAINNLPTDVVQKMGAEIVIAIDLSTGETPKNELRGMMGMVNRLVDIMGEKKYEHNKENSDLYVNPDLKGFSAASFSKEAVDTMIIRGEHAARAILPQIRALKEKIYGDTLTTPVDTGVSIYKRPESYQINNVTLTGIEDKDQRWLRRFVTLQAGHSYTLTEIDNVISDLYGTALFSNVEYKLSPTAPYDLELIMKRKPQSSINLGIRFDSEQMASIILNTTVNRRIINGASFDATFLLNQSPSASLGVTWGSDFTQKIGLNYTARYYNFKIYNRGDKVDSPSFVGQSLGLNFSDIYFNFRFDAGIRYDFFTYNDFLYTKTYEPVKQKTEGFLNYYMSFGVDTYDQKYFPTRGVEAYAMGDMVTSNFATYKGGSPIGIASFKVGTVARLSNRVHLIPDAQGRFLFGNKFPEIYLNYMGGNMNARYLNQQIAFDGMRNMEIMNDALFTARLALRYRLGSKHYIQARGQYAKDSDNFLKLFHSGKDYFGGALQYAYNSLLGPIAVSFNTSNVERFGVYVSLGYNF